MTGRMLCALSAAAVVAGGIVAGAPAHAASTCGSYDPKWTYTTSAINASLSYPTWCYPGFDHVSVSLRIERCDAMSCTHTPTVRRKCDSSVKNCAVSTHLDHGPVEEALYYIDTSVSAWSRTRGYVTSGRTVLNCTSAAVASSC
jgi:hypothetical protein